MMKIVIGAAAAVLVLASVTQAENVRTPVNPPYAFSRGLANMMFGWLEMPRGLVYENARIPGVGFVAGPVKGATLMTWRTLAGSMDVVCMGLTRDGLYTAHVPEFVWDADWVPECGEDMASMTSIEGEPCIDAPRRRKSRKVKQQRVIIKDPCEPCDGTPCAAASEAREVEVIEAPVVVEPSSGFNAVPRSMVEKPEASAPVDEPAAKHTGARQPFGLGSDDEMDARVQALESEVAMIEEHVAPMREVLCLPADRMRARGLK